MRHLHDSLAGRIAAVLLTFFFLSACVDAHPGSAAAACDSSESAVFRSECAEDGAQIVCDELAVAYDACGFSLDTASCLGDAFEAYELLDASCEELEESPYRARLNDDEQALVELLEESVSTQAQAQNWVEENFLLETHNVRVPLPGNKGYLMLRQESHPMGGNPCPTQMPEGVPIQHFNIEVHVCDVPGPGCSGRSIYNLHMAAWLEPSGVPCYAMWENQLSGPRCLGSGCLNGRSLEEVWEVMKEGAWAYWEAIESALIKILESVYNMHPLVASALALTMTLLLFVLILLPPTGIPG